MSSNEWVDDSEQKTVLFHVQHFLGIGHLIRAIAIADALAQRFHVVLVTGGRLPENMAVAPEVEIRVLPALGFDAERSLTSLVDGASVEDVLHRRAEKLVSIYEEVVPDVVLVELFPFGRKKLAGELMSLLRLARADRRAPLIACSVRDILVTGRRDQPRHDERASRTSNEFFDLVLVHGDDRFATLSESFDPVTPHTTPEFYTGFVRKRPSTRAHGAKSHEADGRIVISAGGGWVGGALMYAGLAAAPIFYERFGLHTTLITGPLADSAETHALHRVAREEPTVEIISSVPDLLETLRTAAASISQAGYNTTIDLLQAGLPTVVVPYGDAAENEQLRRAQRLSGLDLAVVVQPSDANAGSLADALARAFTLQRPAYDWSFEGAHNSTEILRRTLVRRERVGV
ncbi:MAG: glycosyltransferase [Acidimicrobiia bacterium]|nr:glycosyltransferase [Acidimicrobiia bacterium]